MLLIIQPSRYKSQANPVKIRNIKIDERPEIRPEIKRGEKLESKEAVS